MPRGPEPAHWLAVFELNRTRRSRTPEPPLGAVAALMKRQPTVMPNGMFCATPGDAAEKSDATGPGGAYRGTVISYQWRGAFTTAEAEALHAEGFGRARGDRDWKAQVERHSLGWVCARRGAELAGFVNVAWDGGVHAFILDTVVARGLRRHGIGTRLVEVAAREASSAGCEWLHVDFGDHLRPFYFGSCGFQPTNAGLISMTGPSRRRQSSFRAHLAHNL